MSQAVPMLVHNVFYTLFDQFLSRTPEVGRFCKPHLSGQPGEVSSSAGFCVVRDSARSMTRSRRDSTSLRVDWQITDAVPAAPAAHPVIEENKPDLEKGTSVRFGRFL